jgi:hypothetical protein
LGTKENIEISLLVKIEVGGTVTRHPAQQGTEVAMNEVALQF